MTSHSTVTAPQPSYGEQLTLIAIIRAKAGMGDELGRRLGTLVEPSRKEPGNVNYDLHRLNDSSDVWVIYENWKKASDLVAHFEYPYMKELLASLPDILDGDMDLIRCSMVSKVAG